MDSQDSSAPPPHVNHHHHPHHHQHHNPQPPLPSHHALLMGPHTQSQQHPSNMAYPLPNNSHNNSVPTTTATSNTAGVMHQQNPGFPFNSMAPAQKPMDHQYSDGSPSAGGGGWFNTEPARKKRGRPRKYSLDNNIDLGLSPSPVAQISSSAAGRLDSGGAPSAYTPAKRNRGRPPGSGKKQMDSLGVPGVGFTPHVITVDAGEDIASKIMAFSQQGPRAVCILSANGAICNVTLRQPAVSGSPVTYEGRFEIISLSGSFLTSEAGGAHSKSGGLSVSLAGSDGRVLGGGVAGALKAASPVQVVVGSFIAECKRPKPVPSSAIATNNTLPSSNRLNFGATPSSPGGSSESADENDGNSPAPPHGSGLYANAVRPEHSGPIYSNMGWPNSM